MRTPIFVGGREVAVKTVCDPCVEKDKDQIRRRDARQSGYLEAVEGVEREQIIHQLLLDAGANPWEHGESTLDSFDTIESGPRPLGSAREFAAAVHAAGKFDPVRGLYLHGDTGTGKTRLAVGVMRYLIEHDYKPGRIVFDHAAELIARIQDTYGRKDERTMDVLERRYFAGLWILDDFGTERASDDVIRHLTTIFARRAQQPNLITSNFSPEQLQKERPEFFRILSRLGPKYFRTVEISGRDRRFD